MDVGKNREGASRTADTPPARLCFVSGHEFGFRAATGIVSSDAFKRGHLQFSLVVALDERHEPSTVGYRDLTCISDAVGASSLKTADGTLRSLRRSIETSAPDYLLVVGWSRIVAEEVLDIPRHRHNANNRQGLGHGCIGMHPTLLPIGRGQAPIPWTIIRGLGRSGLSVFGLEAVPDAGAIIRQYAIDISSKETATSLYRRFADLHEQAGFDLAADLAHRRLRWTPQREHDATVWPKRRPIDGRIDFRLPADAIERLVRALTPPYPPAWIAYAGGALAVSSARIVSGSATTSPPAGTVLEVHDETTVTIATATSPVRLELTVPAQHLVPGSSCE